MDYKENKKPDFILRTRWDKYNTTLLTRKLYTHVEKGDITFNIKARKGSLWVEILIWTLNLELEILKALLIYYIVRRIDRKKLEKPEFKDRKGEDIPLYIG